jgi:aminopeptidase N
MQSKIILFAFILLSRIGLADQYPRNESVDIKHYTFKLELNDSTDIISGEAHIQLLVRKPFTEIEFDLVNTNMQQKGMTVKSVTLTNSRLKFMHQNNRLHITLSAPATVNETLTFIIQYSGTPANGLIISRNKYGDRTFFGDNWPDRARNWIPCIDHPYDKAGVDFIVTAPVHYSVIANGIKKEESYVGFERKRTHWHESVDLPTKVMVIGVARFAIEYQGEVNNIPVENWVYPQNRFEGFTDYDPSVPILDFFIRLIGPYSYKKLANVQSTTIYGGMENASNIFYYENSVTGRNEIDDLIAHEVAHQWFGNSASEADWHHVWLSEGFATYFTHVYNEFTHGKEQAQQDRAIDRGQVIAYNKKSPAPIINTAVTQYSKLLTNDVYQRGGWFLHMLRKEVGDSAFFHGVREYYRTYQNKNALTDDLQLIMEKQSGKALEPFFEQWLRQPHIPVLKSSWTYDSKTGTAIITIDQNQPGKVFNFPLDLEIQTADSEKRVLETVRVTQKSEKIEVKVPGKPVKIILDPQVNLLFEDISRN